MKTRPDCRCGCAEARHGVECMDCGCDLYDPPGTDTPGGEDDVEAFLQHLGGE